MGISRHQLAVYEFVRDCRRWTTVLEIAEAAGISRRTASTHAAKFARQGLFEHYRMFPCGWYRLAPKPNAVGRSVLHEMEQAGLVMRRPEGDRE